MLWPMTKTCVDQSELVNVRVKIDQLTICLGPSTIGFSFMTFGKKMSMFHCFKCL